VSPIEEVQNYLDRTSGYCYTFVHDMYKLFKTVDFQLVAAKMLESNFLIHGETCEDIKWLVKWYNISKDDYSLIWDRTERFNQFVIESIENEGADKIFTRLKHLTDMNIDGTMNKQITRLTFGIDELQSNVISIDEARQMPESVIIPKGESKKTTADYEEIKSKLSSLTTFSQLAELIEDYPNGINFMIKPNKMKIHYLADKNVSQRILTRYVNEDETSFVVLNIHQEKCKMYGDVVKRGVNGKIWMRVNMMTLLDDKIVFFSDSTDDQIDNYIEPSDIPLNTNIYMIKSELINQSIKTITDQTTPECYILKVPDTYKFKEYEYDDYPAMGPGVCVINKLRVLETPIEIMVNGIEMTLERL
jgi:hypothetical protein